MLLHLLNLMDIICAGMLAFSSFIPSNIVLAGAMYLIFKGIYFGMLGNIPSWIDIFVGIYMFLAAIGVTSIIITIVSIIYLLQKSLWSFLR